MKKVVVTFIIILVTVVSSAQRRGKIRHMKPVKVERPSLPTPIDEEVSCCPPWNPEVIKANTRIVTSPTGGLNANYTIKFTPTYTLRNQMQAYIDYMHAMNPSVTAIITQFQIYNKGADTCESTNGNGIPVGGDQFATWNANGNGNSNSGNFWGGYPLEVGIWYTIHTGIYVNDGHRVYDQSCDNNDVCVRIQVKSGMPIIEFSYDGEITKELLNKK